jgi:small-conductance mechanosensitive channel
VLEFVNRTVDWYRDVVLFDRTSARAEEVLFREAVGRSARQALRYGFEYGRAEAERALAAAAASGPAASGGAGGKGRLRQSAAAAGARVSQLRNELEAVSKAIAGASGATLESLNGRRDTLVAELDLANARLDALERMAGLGVTDEGGGLAGKLDALERSVPEALGDGGGAATTRAVAAGAGASAAAAEPEFHLQSAGVIKLLNEMFRLSGRMSELRGLADRAEGLRKAGDEIRRPMRTSLQEALRRADALGSAAATTAPTTAPVDPKQVDARRRELEGLAARFRAMSAVSVPLAQQAGALDATRANLLEWRTALGRAYGAALRRLLWRLAGTGLAILVVVGVSAVWRRATFRYVHDARRRRQFMLVRRVVIALVIVLVGLASFVTEFGSIATFAGILTAGIAVSLQTLILSGVAYFFFIGRYGVRVGDRVTVGNVTGDVVETGLFRLYLMEMSGTRQLRPTGRIVVFSNSVLFQPSGFYKQMPGSEYVWHEVALTLAPDSDHRLAERRLLGAVEGVFAEYRDVVERQYARVSRSSPLTLEPPKTEGRLRFVDAGLEFVVRYPVEIRRAAEVDDRVTRRLLEAIEEEPRLRLVAAGTPRIQAAGEGK